MTLQKWLQRHSLTVYFILAYAISWAVAIPVAASVRGWLPRPLPFALHYLTAYGPLLAAVTVTALTEGRAGLKALGKRLAKWRLPLRWWLVALSPLWLYGVAAVVLRFAQGQWPDVTLLGEVNFLPNLGLGALLLWLLTFGVGEEVGWRGYALPRLQQNRSALSASLILWVFWLFWHLPQFFYLHQFATVMGIAFGLLGGTIVLTWLYNSSGGSLLILTVWHGTFNFITVSAAGEGLVAAVLSTVVMVWAVVVVVWLRPPTLSRTQKQVA